MDGCPLGLGLVVEDKPTEFSCRYASKSGINPMMKIVGTSHLEATLYIIDQYRKSGNFRCKNSFLVNGSYEYLSYEKRMRTINANVVRDPSYENFSTQKLII